MSWTDERVEQLRQLWIEGKSASNIASALGHGLTRNAVIGKVHRLGLAGRAKAPGSTASQPRPPSSQPGAQRPAASPRTAPVARRIVRGATALAIEPHSAVEAEPVPFETVVLPMSLRVTIVELKEAMCRWPLGDPANSDFRYCGSTVAGGPYCAHHLGLAYQPANERRRDRDRRLALR